MDRPLRLSLRRVLVAEPPGGGVEMRGPPAERRGRPSWEHVLRRGLETTPGVPRPVRAPRPVQSGRSRAVNVHPCLCQVPLRPVRQLSEMPSWPPSPSFAQRPSPPSPDFRCSPGARGRGPGGLPAVPLAPASPALRRRLLRAGGCRCPKPLAVVSKCGLVISGGRQVLRATLGAQGLRCRSWSGARPTGRGFGSDPRSPICAAFPLGGNPSSLRAGRTALPLRPFYA